MVDELELMQRYKKMDTSAFEEIYIYFYKPIYNSLYRIVNNEALAEDLTQETFIKAFRHLDDVEDGKRFSPWLFQIARNTCLDHLRKRNDEYELIDNVDLQDEDLNNPEAYCINQETGCEIKNTLAKLKPSYRKAIKLRYVKDKSYSEIAYELGESISMVKSLLYRARQEFRMIYSAA